MAAYRNYDDPNLIEIDEMIHELFAAESDLNQEIRELRNNKEEYRIYRTQADVFRDQDRKERDKMEAVTENKHVRKRQSVSLVKSKAGNFVEPKYIKRTD